MSKLCFSQTPHDQDGPWSWLVCFSAMMSWMATLGFVFSFGIFFPVFMEFFNEDRERTAWIGSLVIAVLFFTGPFSAVLVNRFGCRLTSLLGTVICATGLATASVAESLVLLYISHGILFGIGTSLIFNASIVIVSHYFSKRRSLALALVTAGSGFGVLVQGPLLQALVDNYGWKTTYRIMAGVVFGICLLGITYDPNVKSEEEKNNLENLKPVSSSSVNDIQPHLRRMEKKEIFLDVSVWKIPAFVAITLSASVAQFGQNVPQIHLVQFCEDLGITTDKASKLYILSGLSAAIAPIPVGRVCDIPGINVFYIYQSAEFFVGLSMFLITQFNNYTAMIVFVVIYGFCHGAFFTTLNVIVMTSVEETKRPAALGWNMQLASIFMASGPPIAGLMADRLGSYDGAFYMSGSVVMVGAAIPFILHITKLRETAVRLGVKSDNKDGDISCWENMAADLNIEGACVESPCDDVTRSVMDASLGVSDCDLFSAQANRLISKESVENASNVCSTKEDQLNVLQLAVDAVVNEAFTMNDEAISNSPEMLQVDFQAEVDREYNTQM